MACLYQAQHRSGPWGFNVLPHLSSTLLDCRQSEKKRSTALSHQKEECFLFLKPHLQCSLRDGKVAGLSVGPRLKDLNN